MAGPPGIEAQRDALENFESWLRATAPRSEFVNLGALVPTLEVHAGAVRFFQEHPEFPGRLRIALAAAGFESDGFAPFFDAYAQAATQASAAELDSAVQSLHTSLAGPLSLLLHVGQPPAWFVTLVSQAPPVAPPADTHTVSASQLQSLKPDFPPVPAALAIWSSASPASRSWASASSSAMA